MTMRNDVRRQQRLRHKLEAYTKSAYLPVTEVGESGLTASKLAGTPWMPKNKPWPQCKGCKRPMLHVVQLNLSTVPNAATAEPELVQLFHCGDPYDCNPGSHIHSPGGRNAVIRHVLAKGDGAHPDAERELHHTPARTIVGWEETLEHPSGQDVADLTLNSKEQRLLSSLGPSGDTKLGGWPDWVQGADWPACPTCGSKMRLLLQLRSEHHIPVSFGDGLAYVMQCTQHPKKLAVSWSFT